MPLSLHGFSRLQCGTRLKNGLRFFKMATVHPCVQSCPQEITDHLHRAVTMGEEWVKSEAADATLGRTGL